MMAEAAGTPASEFIREAIAAHLAARRADPEFQARLRERMEADRQILQRLRSTTERRRNERPGS